MSKKQPEVPKGSILVVDDTPDNLRLLMGILAEQGYDVRPAPNGTLALNSVQSILPDLILLDIRMPDMDGYAVCERLKADEHTCDIPVIFISALHDVADKVEGFARGGVDYITKPFQPEEVLARVQTHLALRKLQTRLQKNNDQLQQEIIKRTQAEDELRELNQQLKKANASKDKFFSIIAHDLRSPFNWFLGFTEIITTNIECYSKNEIKNMVSELRTGTEKLYALIQNLLTWSRLQRGLIEQHPMEITLNTIAERVIFLFVPGAKQKQITLTNQVPPGTTAYADDHMVDAVMRNLISNALKFTEKGGTITVSVQNMENAVEVVVADTGIGISQEDMEKLFRIDVKYTNVGTAGEEGTGLGLLLCKELVEKNGGQIRVESEIGKGTTFRFTLPKVSRS